MSKRVLFEDDKEIGRKVWLIFNDHGEVIGAHVEQNIDQIIEANRQAEIASHGQKFGDYNRIASVPLTSFEKLGLGDAIDHQDNRYIKKVLNDSDYSGFRTSRGKV